MPEVVGTVMDRRVFDTFGIVDSVAKRLPERALKGKGKGRKK